MRQLTTSAGAVTLVQNYDPYGNVLSTPGSANAATSYGYTGEWTDTTGLVHLRARDYAPALGRFLARDSWPGEVARPITLNKWTYSGPRCQDTKLA